MGIFSKNNSSQYGSGTGSKTNSSKPKKQSSYDKAFSEWKKQIVISSMIDKKKY